VSVLWLDKYERRARLVPGLLALLPVAVTITALGLRQAPVVSVVVSLLSLAGGPVLLADTVRSLGLRAQDRLWVSWGGAPTTSALRLRDRTSNEVQRDIWRQAVHTVTGIQLASTRSEAPNPAQADQKIEAAVGRIRELTRDDQRFYMVQAENRAYGYRRNFYAVRHLGRLVALLGLVVILGFVFWPTVSGKHPDVQAAYLLGALVDAVIAAGWYVLPSSGRVRQAGDKYAYQLLQAAATLAADTNASTTPAGNDQAQ
jgi:hypothetical protein